jgi:hypothetical protein
MRSRNLIRPALLIGALALAVTRGDARPSARQSAIVYLREPTLIGSVIVEGPVLFVHDTRRMGRGEPCTTVYLVEPPNKATEEVVSFHCIPTGRKVVNKFTVTTRPNTALGFGCVLTEFQFAGDSEGHGVPDAAVASASVKGVADAVIQ